MDHNELGRVESEPDSVSRGTLCVVPFVREAREKEGERETWGGISMVKVISLIAYLWNSKEIACCKSVRPSAAVNRIAHTGA